MTDLARLHCVLLLLSALPTLSFGQHVCVPGPDGKWNCGSPEQPPEAAALPQRQAAPGTQSVPPVLLMDPTRFNPSQDAATAAAPAPSVAPGAAAATPASIPVSTAAPVRNITGAVSTPATPTVSRAAAVPAPAPVSRTLRLAAAAPVTTSTTALRDLTSLPSSGYTLQLAAAQSSAGFARRLRELGLAPEQAFAVPVQRAGAHLWLLCVGQYADAASARAAVPAGATGAFPKPLAQLHAELSSNR